MSKEFIAGRELILRNIEESLKKSQSTLILGEPGLGKSKLLQDQFEKIKKENRPAAHIKLGRISLSPERFAVEFIGQICHSHLNAPTREYKKFFEIEKLKTECSKLPKAASDIISIIDTELQKIKPNQKELVKKAFEFPSTLRLTKDFIVFIDDFDLILQMNNFEQIRDVISLIDFTKSCFFVASASALKQGKGNNSLNIINLLPLTKEECDAVAKIYLAKYDSTVARRIADLSGGEPWLVKNLCQRHNTTQDIQKTIFTEFLFKDSATTQFLKEYYFSAISKARGETLLKTILNVLAEKEGLRLSELARNIYKSAPVTKSLLERLIAVDLVRKDEKNFSVASRPLALWLKYRHLEVNSIEDIDNMDKEVMAL